MTQPPLIPTDAASSPWLRRGLLVAAVAAFGGLLGRGPAPFSTGFAVATRPPDTCSPTHAVFEVSFANSGKTEQVHSPVLVDIGDDAIRAFWLGGSSEGASDVAIYTAVLDRDDGTWSEEVPIISRVTTQDALHRYVNTVGNPVVMRDELGQLWLWYVSVSIGGWSGSAINLTISDDDGATWTPPRRLITSPFFNISTLVKTPPIRFEDGTIGLPVYHELFGKFAELLRLDDDGRVIHKQRLSSGDRCMQPLVLPRTRDDATVLLRRTGSAPYRVLTISTADGGRTWSDMTSLDMPNPGCPLAGARLSAEDLLLVFNDHESERDDLSFALTSDEGATYSVIHDLEKPPAGEFFEYGVRYPDLIRTPDGCFHLLCSYRRTGIKYVHFNEAWLNEQR